jgi:uncharacterized membrane protein YeaQ/YmgE (transglycosylase-associated protein family)
MSWLIALIIGAVAGVVVSQTQKLSGGTQAMVISGVAGAVAGLLGNALLGWLGQFIGQVALVAALGGLAVYGLKQANVPHGLCPSSASFSRTPCGTFFCALEPRISAMNQEHRLGRRFSNCVLDGVPIL